MKTVIVFFSFFCFVFLQANDKRLILHFDINQTIIACDPAGKRNEADVLNHALAKKFCDIWDANLDTKESYYDYIFEHQFPGPRSSRAIKSKRRITLSRFVDYLKENNHPFFIEAYSQYDKCLKRLKIEVVVFW